jgi:uncharacterized protein YcfJ
MKSLIAIAAAAATALTGVAAPTLAAAQYAPSGVYYREDPCYVQRHNSGTTGAVIGGIAGAVLGSQVAGRGARTEGAVIGGAAGAVAGHQIGRHSVKCGAYPAGYRVRKGCRWVHDRYQGRNYSYEVCRGRDGYWRPVR